MEGARNLLTDLDSRCIRSVEGLRGVQILEIQTPQVGVLAMLEVIRTCQPPTYLRPISSTHLEGIVQTLKDLNTKVIMTCPQVDASQRLPNS